MRFLSCLGSVDIPSKIIVDGPSCIAKRTACLPSSSFREPCGHIRANMTMPADRLQIFTANCHVQALTQDIVCTVAGVLWAKQVHRLDIGK